MREDENNSKRRYRTAKSFASQIELYFNSLREPLLAYNKKERRSEFVFDENGEMVFHNVRPPTMSGLSAFLGFHSRTTIGKYEELGAEWADAVTRARLRIEQSWTELLVNKDSQKGAEFFLRCTCGYMSATEKREIELRERQTEKDALSDRNIDVTIKFEDCSE